MDKQKFKEIGADSLPALLAKANQREIAKEQFVQVVQVGKEFHLIYVD